MKKFFSFFAALLFAGSMMATPYTLTFNYYDNTGSDKSSAETTLEGLFDAASMDYVDAEAAFTIDKVYLGRKYKDKVSGDSIFSNIKFGSSSAAGTLKFALKNMAVDSVIFRAAMYGDSEGTDGFSVNGTAFTLSAGNKTFENVKYVPAGDITALEIVQTKASKGRFYLTSITVYPNEGGVVPPTPAIVAPYCQTEVGHLFLENPDPNSFVLLSIGAANGKTIVRIDQDTVKNTQMFDYLQVTGLASEGADVAEGGAAAMAVEFDTPTAVNDSITLEILWSTVNWEGRWMIQNVKVPATAACASAVLVEVPVELPDPTNCAEAREAALSVENNNDLYKDGAVYSITGYVTAIQTAYNAQYNNVSFWMADAADGGNVIQAFRAACASAEDAPIVGDKVTVTGSLTKYNTTPEFAAGCTYVIVEHATPVVPQNLGEKTIAEFIALANTVDTCVITGVVANIKKNSDGSYNKYGNFDLVDGEASIYVYGLLTADGVAQKFQEMGVDEGDVLTVKAVYSLYNNAVQAKNAVFVAVEKPFNHELYGSATLPVVDKTWFATTDQWVVETNSHAEIVNDYDINVVLVDPKAGQWQSQVFVNPGFTWEVGAYYKMEFDLATNNQLGGVTVKVNNDDNAVFYYSYPNDNVFLANQTTHFIADSIYAKAEPTDGGQLIFAFGWTAANTEILISNIVITKYEAPVEPIDITVSSITTPGALVWTDAVASAGWWQIMGTTENYEFSLSNVSTTETAGVYTIDDLDPDYSYITVMTATDTTDVTFVDGSVTVAVANDGTVTIVGALVGDDGNTYNFNLTYVDPKAERLVNVTISNGNLYDGYASYGLYAVYGTADDKTAYVQLAIWAKAGFDGEFTEEDLDLQNVGSGVRDADGSHSIFSAVINVLPGEGEGVYSIMADLLCYNNTLYKVSMSIGKTEGFENVDAAVKAIKRLVNGNVVIEKAGKKYNVNGANL